MAKINRGRTKRYGLYALAIAMTLAAIAILLFGARHSSVQLLVGLALVLGAVLLKLSRTDSSAIRPTITESESPDRPGPLMWAVGAVLLIALAISYHYFYEDALNGHHQIVPVYAFAVIGMACVIFWAYLLSNLLG